MKNLEEQRVCVKFYFKFGKKKLRRLFRCCNRLTERIVWAVRNVTSGTSDSNRAERPSKTTPNLDGLARQRTIALRKCLLWFVKMFHVVRQAIKSSTLTSWSVWGRQCEGRGLRRGQTPRCCTMTMHLLTRHSSVNFWRSMRRLLSPSHHTLQIWPLRTFYCSRSWNPH